MRGAAVEVDAIGEQQPKRTRSGTAAEADTIGSSSWSGRKRRACSICWSGRNRGAAALHRELSSAGLLTVGERGGSNWASERRYRGAAAEADAIGSSSWSGRKRRACSSSWSGCNRGAAALHRELSGAGILTVGERGGSSWASEASEATCISNLYNLTTLCF